MLGHLIEWLLNKKLKWWSGAWQHSELYEMHKRIVWDAQKNCKREIAMPYLCGCPRKEQQAGRKDWEWAVGLNVGVAQGAILVLDFFSILKLTFCSSHPVTGFSIPSLRAVTPKIYLQFRSFFCLCTCISVCLLSISTWIYRHYNMFKIES